MIKGIIAVLCVIGLAGCASNTTLLSDIRRVETGSPTSDVELILGKAQKIQYNEPDEPKTPVVQWAWQYCGSTMNSDLYATVWYYKGVVTGVQTYEVKRIKQLNKTCADYFEHIKWTEAPAPGNK